MEIKKKFLSKYLHSIAIDQIADDYLQKGYIIEKERLLGGYRADLIVKKNNEQIVIEVKADRMTPEKRLQIAGMADQIKSLDNYKFLVVVATPPKEKRLEIEGLEQLISNYMHDNLPDELDELSTHTRPDEVSEVEIDSIEVKNGLILVSGNGVVSVELQFGSDSDQDDDNGLKSYDNFPFVFSLVLKFNKKNELKIVEVDDFEINTSSYYDNE